MAAPPCMLSTCQMLMSGLRTEIDVPTCGLSCSSCPTILVHHVSCDDCSNLFTFNCHFVNLIKESPRLPKNRAPKTHFGTLPKHILRKIKNTPTINLPRRKVIVATSSIMIPALVHVSHVRHIYSSLQHDRRWPSLRHLAQSPKLHQHDRTRVRPSAHHNR